MLTRKPARKTFDSIVAGLSTMVSDLKALAAEQGEAALDKATQAKLLQDESNAHDAERLRALATAEKVAGLIA